MTLFTQPISSMIWDIKYRYRQDGQVLENSIEETWQRVAKAIAKPEKTTERQYWENAFYQILNDFHFLPGGRILAGAGTTHKVTLFNCFVMTIKQDSLAGIFQALKEGALTLQQGGGVGYDFSVLRPYGDWVHKTGIPSSGPISFMRIWDTTCGILQSTGARRGAMMGVMRCDHPDIEEFIVAKRDSRELRHFNVSVYVSDEFMAAVKQDSEWVLVFPSNDLADKDIIYRQWSNTQTPVACKVYKRVKARELWEKIIRSAYDYAEPGVLFGDTINRYNTLSYCENIYATNPCGEIPLPAYGACDLGAINLTRFIVAPFTTQAKIDWLKLEETVKIATRFLDNVIDVSHYPLKAQRHKAQDTRRIGLGLTGLANVFVMLGIPYGSEESIKLAREIMHKIAHATWQTSIELAKEKGVFPALRQKEYLQSVFVQTLEDDIRKSIQQFGIRNSHHNTIAPTGTTSLLANNVSNGIEPIFQAEYQRYVRAANGEMLTFGVKDYAYQQWLKLGKQDMQPPAWIDAHTLCPTAHLQVQAAMQPYIDNAISKTINIPKDFPLQKVMDVYSQAYELGLKGCTIFRPNPITGSVLSENPVTAADQCCQHD